MQLSFLKLILPIIFPIFPNILLSAVLKMSFRWHSDLDASQLNKNVFHILLGLLFIEIDFCLTLITLVQNLDNGKPKHFFKS